MDTLVFRSDEGRGYQRNVLGNWKQVLIQEYPNKETSRTTSWINKEERANLVNWNILVTRGKESKSDSLSSGERKGTSPVITLELQNFMIVEVCGKAHHRRWESCKRNCEISVRRRVRRDTSNLVGICEDHLVRLNTTNWPIVNQYREGKVKRTAEAEWKDPETLCLQQVRAR